MKNIKLLIGLTLISMLIYSCEDPLNTSTDSDIAEQLVGQWKCDESSTYYKSSGFKGTDRIYYVNIFQSGSDSTIVQIENFYELGSNVVARAEVSGSSIILKNETLDGGFSIRGSGTISSNLQTITWLYYVDDGSGEEDEVSSTYTFVY